MPFYRRRVLLLLSGEEAVNHLLAIFFCEGIEEGGVTGYTNHQIGVGGGIGMGLAVMLLPLPAVGALAGLVLTGLGCAPIYPSLIHATPAFFGKERSQAVIGVQMAGAYVGSSFAPPLFGLLGSILGLGSYPVYLLGILLLMIWMYRRLLRITACRSV